MPRLKREGGTNEQTRPKRRCGTGKEEARERVSVVLSRRERIKMWQQQEKEVESPTKDGTHKRYLSPQREG